MITAFTGALYAWIGRYEDGIREAHRSFDIQKDCPDGYFVLGETYLAMGREDLAIESHKKLAEVDPLWNWVLGATYAITNHPDEAEVILNELLIAEITSWSAMGIARIFGALGKMDDAMKWLAYEPHHAWIPWITAVRSWKPKYEDKRYDDFVLRLNIPTL